MPSCEMMILEHAKILLEKPSIPSCKPMIFAHVDIPPAQDKTQVMPSCETMIQESRCGSQATQASTYSHDSVCSTNNLFVGLMMVTMSIHLFMFFQNSREGDSSTSLVGSVDYSDNSTDDGSFTDGNSGGNSSSRNHGGRKGGNDSSGVDGNVNNDSVNTSGISGVIFCCEIKLDGRRMVSLYIDHSSVLCASDN